MSTYSKKKEQKITFVMQLSFIVVALVGWFMTNSILDLVGILLFSFGVLIFIMILRKNRKERLLDQTGVGRVEFMDQKTFKQYVMNFFKEEGYLVKLAPANKASDTILTLKKGDEAIVVFVHTSDKTIDIPAMQQAVAALPKYTGHQAWAITNNQYNAAAIGIALQNHITPLDREDLLERALLCNIEK